MSNPRQEQRATKIYAPALPSESQRRPIPRIGSLEGALVGTIPGRSARPDFEGVSLGPREWDIGSLPNVDLTAFEPINRDVLSALSVLRSLCVSVWCWAKYDMPEKREAAEYHLQYLKQRFA